MAISKNSRVSGGEKATQEVKYLDPRMSYMSSKKDLVVKESENLKMKDIFGEEILAMNSPVVLCEDQNGLYLTGKNMIDEPVLDQYRMYKRNEYDIVKDEDAYKVSKNGKEYLF